jgi:hypothetical protein
VRPVRPAAAGNGPKRRPEAGQAALQPTKGRPENKKQLPEYTLPSDSLRLIIFTIFFCYICKI